MFSVLGGRKQKIVEGETWGRMWSWQSHMALTYLLIHFNEVTGKDQKD